MADELLVTFPETLYQIYPTMAAYEQAMIISEVGPIQLYRAPCVDLTLEDEEGWARPSCVKVREDKTDLISQLQDRVKELMELHQRITQLEQEEEEEAWVRPQCIKTMCACEVDDKWANEKWYAFHAASGECHAYKPWI